MAQNRAPVPIGGRQPRPAQREQQPQQQSSLDIVFSFSRSQAFFGSNLPSSPSFVARYRRPTQPEDEESSLAASEGERERRASTASEDDEDGTRWSDGEDGDDEEVIQDIVWGATVTDPHRHQSASSAEQLPRNAAAQRRPGRTSSQRSSRQAPSPMLKARTSSHQHETAEPSERDSLLSPNGHSPPDSVPFPRRSSDISQALQAAHLKKYGTLSSPDDSPTTPTAAKRKYSIMSGVDWDEAVARGRGTSSFGQTLFNTVNALIGVGLLAEPLAFADAGWVLGTLLLLFCALLTNYTAKMLARLMSRDISLLTYADILVKAYGPRSRPYIHLMFILELGSVSIAMVVLFGDSMSTLFPRLASDSFKLIAYAIILPITFLPLRLLAITSLLGILSSFTLFCVLLSDGLVKKTAPGSLWEPLGVFAGPRWMRLPLSLGLIMSGFSGHAVVPSLYRDMKNPARFDAMINTTYVVAFTISMLMGAIGYAMFGRSVSDEITRDILITPGFPKVLGKVAMWMVALSPIAKYGVTNTPFLLTVEHVFGVYPDAPLEPKRDMTAVLDGSAIGTASSTNASQVHAQLEPTMTRRQRILSIVLKPILLGVIVVLAIVIPDFQRVLAFLGSASAFLICCVFPIGAFLILRDDGGARGWERAVAWVLLVVSVICAVVGTVWSFLNIPIPQQ